MTQLFPISDFPADPASTLPRTKEARFEAGGTPRSVIVVRHGHRLSAFENVCPHRQVPLNWAPDAFLNIERTALLCGMHGALFSLDDGTCLHGPCAGHGLTRLDVAEIDGYVTLLDP